MLRRPLLLLLLLNQPAVFVAFMHTQHSTGQHSCCAGVAWCSCLAWASSYVSRAAPAALLSPISMKPAGMVHRPLQGSIALHVCDEAEKDESARQTHHASMRTCTDARTPAAVQVTVWSTICWPTVRVQINRLGGCCSTQCSAEFNSQQWCCCHQPFAQQDFPLMLHHTAYNHPGVEVICTAAGTAQGSKHSTKQQAQRKSL